LISTKTKTGMMEKNGQDNFDFVCPLHALDVSENGLSFCKVGILMTFFSGLVTVTQKY
jgi:hypothetical protein